ncbi:hypothetical protein HanXRQr2_Chr13g0570941 [Helianthus annuus]|uniref:Uncharacterized protein n=1 Tax=Helianthus annuus TaxID=4232 RepID=A0A9K3EDM1_HELAN|nr:hypothetical protein HanXRQr2_Chr13g0570941 [Helianthus annuus]KAJ0479594.1 hypothetical protein HanIR_Chr13g0621811 [Helianthus annuus]KAJ0847811.1 hypothetical protein HanPSC8_Chr13g0549641 [Helianthus annuus]
MRNPSETTTFHCYCCSEMNILLLPVLHRRILLLTFFESHGKGR